MDQWLFVKLYLRVMKPPIDRLPNIISIPKPLIQNSSTRLSLNHFHFFRNFHQHSSFSPYQTLWVEYFGMKPRRADPLNTPPQAFFKKYTSDWDEIVRNDER
jgi:hypothetical protein